MSTVVLRLTPSANNSRVIIWSGERTMTDRLWTAQELADYFGVPIGTVYQWNSKHTGPRSIRVGKHVRYSQTEVDRWCAAQLSAPVGA